MPTTGEINLERARRRTMYRRAVQSHSANDTVLDGEMMFHLALKEHGPRSEKVLRCIAIAWFIQGGMTVEQVAETSGESRENVERYKGGPVGLPYDWAPGIDALIEQEIPDALDDPTRLVKPHGSYAIPGELYPLLADLRKPDFADSPVRAGDFLVKDIVGE
jgi:hypothetical protein